jgi:hypothetical protein
VAGDDVDVWYAVDDTAVLLAVAFVIVDVLLDVVSVSKLKIFLRFVLDQSKLKPYVHEQH